MALWLRMYTKWSTIADMRELAWGGGDRRMLTGYKRRKRSRYPVQAGIRLSEAQAAKLVTLSELDELAFAEELRKTLDAGLKLREKELTQPHAESPDVPPR